MAQVTCAFTVAGRRVIACERDILACDRSMEAFAMSQDSVNADLDDLRGRADAAEAGGAALGAACAADATKAMTQLFLTMAAGVKQDLIKEREITDGELARVMQILVREMEELREVMVEMAGRGRSLDGRLQDLTSKVGAASRRGRSLAAEVRRAAISQEPSRGPTLLSPRASSVRR